jgi:hypothetical protein
MLRPLLISDPGGAALGGTNLGSRLGERALMDQQGRTTVRPCSF